MRFCMFGAQLAMVLMLSEAAAAKSVPIQVEAGAKYKHQASNVTLPATLGGIPRAHTTAFSDDLLDVGSEYIDADQTEYVSIYLFRNVSGDVPVWFDRARTAILNLKDKYPGAKPTGIRAFVPKGQKLATGLMEVMTTDGPLKSTGLMVLPFSGFYAKLRVSSKVKGPTELEQMMWSIANEIDWKSKQNEQTAAPVMDCTSTLTLSANAKPVEASKEDKMASALLSGLMSQMVAADPKKYKTTPGNFCREPNSGSWASDIYRFNQTNDSYMLALGDNGTAITVDKNSLAALMGDKKGKPAGYSVRYILMAKTISYPELDSLPTAERLTDYVDNSAPLSVATTWGDKKEVSISAD